jgi:hypothetical protein
MYESYLHHQCVFTVLEGNERTWLWLMNLIITRKIVRIIVYTFKSCTFEQSKEYGFLEQFSFDIYFVITSIATRLPALGA